MDKVQAEPEVLTFIWMVAQQEVGELVDRQVRLADQDITQDLLTGPIQKTPVCRLGVLTVEVDPDQTMRASVASVVLVRLESFMVREEVFLLVRHKDKSNEILRCNI
jgi:hypothetical protein